MVGSAILRNLSAKGYSRMVLRTHSELDLTDQDAVAAFFSQEKPDYVFLAAAQVGGIIANNTYRAQFIYENLMIQSHVIHQSYLNGVKKLVFLGSSCIYPRMSPQPIREEHLLTGLLEYTNEPYAIAKIAGIKLCEAYHDQYGCDFISVMPTNLYGPGDNYDLVRSHVLPALIRKFHLGRCLENNDMGAIRKDLGRRPVEQVDGQAGSEEIYRILSKYGVNRSGNSTVSLVLWGTGTPRREFLHVDDLAEAVVYIMEQLHAGEIRKVVSDQNNRTEAVFSHLNIGSGEDLTIQELALLVKEIVGFSGKLSFDPTKPDGTPRKQLDVSRLSSMGWKPRIDLEQGIRKVYEDYLGND